MKQSIQILMVYSDTRVEDRKKLIVQKWKEIYLTKQYDVQALRPSNTKPRFKAQEKSLILAFIGGPNYIAAQHM